MGTPGRHHVPFRHRRITSALEQARAAAGDKDVRISGGADVFQQLLRAGLIDEFTVHIAPVLMGGGVRLFERLGPDEKAMEATVARVSQLTTHVSYRVAR